MSLHAGPLLFMAYSWCRACGEGVVAFFGVKAQVAAGVLLTQLLQLVADGADGFGTLASRVQQRPFQGALAGAHQTRVATAHGDSHVGGKGGLVVNDLWVPADRSIPI